jgi:hypothetical protein
VGTQEGQEAEPAKEEMTMEWVKCLWPWKKIVKAIESVKPAYYPNQPSPDDKPGLSRQDVIGLFKYPVINGGR